MFSLSVGACLYPNDVVFGEAWPIHGNPMCCVPTIEVQSSMATKDGSVSQSPLLTFKVSEQSLPSNHSARRPATHLKREEEKAFKVCVCIHIVKYLINLYGNKYFSVIND